MVVQRKWMYLESIFLAGDIRAQLPEEAKKFDNIDKLFKKVGYIHVHVHSVYAYCMFTYILAGMSMFTFISLDYD